MILSFQMPSKKVSNGIKLFIKIAVTGICIWYISGKVDFAKIKTIVAGAQPLWILLSIVCFMLSKYFSALRLNIYFDNIDIQLPHWQNVKLYWLGMFYNLFLPGSIGGDAYKVVRLTREFDVPYKKTAAAVLLDRFSGLAALVMLLAFFWLTAPNTHSYKGWAIAAMVLTLPALYLFIRIFFGYFIKSFWPTFGWGAAVQLLQIATMYCILKALHIHSSENIYLLIFLASSVVAVLPFTIGGLGARELAFVWGAQYFALNNNISITASALFYVITVLASSVGISYIFLDPLSSSDRQRSQQNIQYEPTV